jgi:hypothetical protein
MEFGIPVVDRQILSCLRILPGIPGNGSVADAGVRE